MGYVRERSPEHRPRAKEPMKATLIYGAGDIRVENVGLDVVPDGYRAMADCTALKVVTP
jgi:hypothetical protein